MVVVVLAHSLLLTKVKLVRLVYSEQCFRPDSIVPRNNEFELLAVEQVQCRALCSSLV